MNALKSCLKWSNRCASSKCIVGNRHSYKKSLEFESKFYLIPYEFIAIRPSFIDRRSFNIHFMASVIVFKRYSRIIIRMWHFFWCMAWCGHWTFHWIFDFLPLLCVWRDSWKFMWSKFSAQLFVISRLILSPENALKLVDSTFHDVDYSSHLGVFIIGWMWTRWSIVIVFTSRAVINKSPKGRSIMRFKMCPVE